MIFIGSPESVAVAPAAAFPSSDEELPQAASARAPTSATAKGAFERTFMILLESGDRNHRV